MVVLYRMANNYSSIRLALVYIVGRLTDVWSRRLFCRVRVVVCLRPGVRRGGADAKGWPLPKPRQDPARSRLRRRLPQRYALVVAVLDIGFRPPCVALLVLTVPKLLLVILSLMLMLLQYARNMLRERLYEVQGFFADDLFSLNMLYY